jgi:hypothetical protein
LHNRLSQSLKKEAKGMYDKEDTLSKATFFVYPWDIYDEGIGLALKRIQGCGIDGLELAVSYHVGTYVLPRNPKRFAYFGNHGALYFEPDLALYSKTRIKPVVAEVVEGPDYLNQILGAARQNGMKTNAWVVYCYNHQLARNMKAGKVNVFGDPDHGQLCVANTDIREYCTALTKDVVSNYSFDGILVESLNYMPFGYGFLNPKVAVRFPAEVSLLLGLCFCKYCQQEASRQGIDVTGFMSRLRGWIRDYCQKLPDMMPSPDTVGIQIQEVFGQELVAYLKARRETATSLLEQNISLARQAGKHVAIGGIGQSDPDVTGIDVQRTRQLFDRVFITVPQDSTRETLKAKIEKAKDNVSPSTEIYALVSPGLFDREQSFREMMYLTKDHGINRFGFYNYGILTERHLQWIANACHLWT